MPLPVVTFDFNEIYQLVRPLALFMVGMSAYGIFIFKFYRFLARKDIFALDLEKHNQSRLRFVRKIVSTIMYVFKFLVMFPVFAFFWFVVLAILLLIMASENRTVPEVLGVAIAVLGAIRISAYYNEALSTDLAKILPFALLGIFIINGNILTLEVPKFLASVQAATSEWELLLYYLVLIVVLEFVLRILSVIVGWYKSMTSGQRVRKGSTGVTAVVDDARAQVV